MKHLPAHALPSSVLNTLPLFWSWPRWAGASECCQGSGAGGQLSLTAIAKGSGFMEKTMAGEDTG